MARRRSEPEGEALSRRGFLKAAAAVGAGALAGGLLPGLEEVAEAGATWAFSAPFRQDGLVVIVRSPRAVGPRRAIQSAVVTKMLAAAVTRLTGAANATQAWRRLFAPRDIVGLKVNCLGAPTTHTHVAVALAAARGLSAAGLPEHNLIIYDRLTEELRRAGYPVNTGAGLRCFGTDERGYDAQPTEAGEVGACYSRIVSKDCTALVNVPLLKDHDVAGVSISLKNHFGSINNPNKLHPNGCCPYAADVNLAPSIRGKQRLIVCDALEITYEGGPTYRPATTSAYGALLVGTDPVAVDRVGWKIIEELRAKAKLRPLRQVGREPRYIAVAGDAQHRLGLADLSRIRVVELTV